MKFVSRSLRYPKFFFSWQLLFVILISSCQKINNPINQPEISLWKTIATDGDINFFRKLVELNKASFVFDGNNQFTLIAPKDTAFVLAGFADTNALASLTQSQLGQLLNHLTLKGNYPYSIFTNTSNQSYSTALNSSNYIDSLYFSKFSSTNSLYVDGKRISGYSITASNGTIFIVNTYLPVPSSSVGNLIDSIAQSSHPDFTFLSEALKLTGLNTLLRTKGPFTLLAPNDSAFIQAGYPSVSSLNTMNLTHLTQLLSIHIIPKREFITDLTGAGWNTYNNMGKDSIFISNNSILVNGPDTSQANLIKTDLAAQNGVVHVIDRLLKASASIATIPKNRNLISGTHIDHPKNQIFKSHKDQSLYFKR